MKFISGYGVSPIVHVMAGNANKRYATIFACTRQSTISVNVLFVVCMLYLDQYTEKINSLYESAKNAATEGQTF